MAAKPAESTKKASRLGPSRPEAGRNFVAALTQLRWLHSAQPTYKTMHGSPPFHEEPPQPPQGPPCGRPRRRALHPPTAVGGTSPGRSAWLAVANRPLGRAGVDLFSSAPARHPYYINYRKKQQPADRIFLSPTEGLPLSRRSATMMPLRAAAASRQSAGSAAAVCRKKNAWYHRWRRLDGY